MNQKLRIQRAYFFLIVLLIGLLVGGCSGSSAPESEQPTAKVTLEIRYPDDYEVETSSISIPLHEGSTAQGILIEYGKEYKVPVVLAEGGTYIIGIGGLMERDMGDSFGWVYTVNDESPMVGASEYSLSENDLLVWAYVDFNEYFAE